MISEKTINKLKVIRADVIDELKENASLFSFFIDKCNPSHCFVPSDPLRLILTRWLAEHDI